MKKRYITLNCSQSETEHRLRQQLRVYFPKGIVEENYFRIYKETSGFFLGRGLQRPLFCFFGSFQQSGSKTYVAYRIFPGLSLFLCYFLLIAFAIFSLYQIIFQNEPLFPAIAVIGFLFLYFLIVDIHKKKCMADFEKRLTTESITE